MKQAACYVITHAPLVVKDKILVGTGGGDGSAAGYGIRGLIAAYDAATGREAWRFHTIPGPEVRASGKSEATTPSAI